MAGIPALLQLVRTAEGLSVYRFPGAWMRVVKAPGSRPTGSTWTSVLQVVRALPAGSAALDGPMHGYPGSAADNEMLAMAYDQGKGLYNPSWPGYESRGITLGATPEGGLLAVSGSLAQAELEARGVVAAIQCYPTLVRNGRSPGGFSTDSESTGRAALLQWLDGTMGFAVGVMPMLRFSESLVACGAWNAGYTDGGGSTNLLLWDGRMVAPGHQVRTLRSWIFAVAPASSRGGVGGGVKSSMGSLLAMVAAGGLVAWWVRRKRRAPWV